MCCRVLDFKHMFMISPIIGFWTQFFLAFDMQFLDGLYWLKSLLKFSLTTIPGTSTYGTDRSTVQRHFGALHSDPYPAIAICQVSDLEQIIELL